MGVLDWFRRSDGVAAPAVAWRSEWERALRERDADAAARLRAALHGSPSIADDIEIEEEMLEALEHALVLARELQAGTLPAIETSHRVIGTDACHFSAPASLPDEAAQPSGRLLLTSARAVFVGGAKVTAVPWHAARQAVRDDRDVLLVRGAGGEPLRFRCNTYRDAVAAEAIANHLIGRLRADAPAARRSPL
jgi:hypothetical protein